MKTGLKEVDQLLDKNELLNYEFCEAKRELTSLELNHLLSEMKIEKIDKEKIIQFIESKEKR